MAKALISVADAGLTLEIITAATNDYGDRIVERTLERLGPAFREGEPPPNLQLFFEVLTRFMTLRHAAITERDQDRMDETISQEKARELLAEAERAVRNRVRFVLAAVAEAWGAEGEAAIPFDVVRAQTLDGLTTQVKYMQEALLKFTPSQSLIDPDKSAVNLTTSGAQFAASLDRRLNAMTDARRNLLSGRNLRREAQLTNREAIEAFRRDASAVRALLKAFMRFAELDDLAGQFDETTRRRSSSTDVNNDPPTVVDQPAATAASDDPPTTEHAA